VLQVGGRQKHVSRSGAISYHKTDQSATESYDKWQFLNTRSYTEGDTTGNDEDSECKKVSGSCRISKVEKDKNGEEVDPDWRERVKPSDFKTVKKETDLINVMSNMFSNICYCLYVCLR
jgi:hypothetical protein